MPAIARNGHIYGGAPTTPVDAEDIVYDNSTSELDSTNVQSAIDELKEIIDEGGGGGTDTTYTLSVGTGDDANKIILTPSTGSPDKVTVPYATSAGDSATVSNHTVATDVPANAVFTDTTYSDATTSASGLMSASDKTTINSLGTAAFRDIPTSGDASTSELVLGADSRLSDARPASDVSSWAKASTKPTYTASEVGAIASTAKGANNGVAELDSTGKVPSSQLPSYVDDVLEYNSLSDFPLTGESGKIYIAKDTNKTYRWSGSAYTEISESLALGETSSTAFRGDHGKIAYDHASDANKLTTAQSSGLYKIGVTSEGHVSSATAVAKSDITSLGIPAQDTTYSAASNSGISLNSSTNEFSNSGVRAVTSGSSAQGTINVNTNGTAADVGIKGVYFGRVGSISDLVDINTTSGGDISVMLDQVPASFSYGDRMVVFFYTTYEKDSELSNDVRFKINGGSTWIPVYTNDLARLTLNDTVKLKSGYAYTFTYCEYDEAGCFVVEDLHNYYSASNLLASNVSGGLSGSTVQAQLNNAGTTKQNKTDNSLTTTSKTVVGAINEVSSGLIDEAEDIAEINAALDVPAGAGKNRLPLVLANIKAANTTGTWSGNDYNTGSGITYTVNVDTAGNVTSIVANGTASANADLELLKRPANLTAFTNMIINGSVNGSAETWGIGVAGYGIVFVNGDNTYLYGYTLANGLYIRVISGVTVTNQTFTPMIRPATITDATFAPYIPSVDARLDAVESAIKVSRVTVSPDANGYVNLSPSGFTKAGFKYVNAVVTGASSARSYDVRVWLSDNYGWVASIYIVDTFTKVTDTSVSLDLVVFGIKA